MSIADLFKQFSNNLKIDNTEQISDRYQGITGYLNKKYRETEAKTANCLQVGSYGRKTAIKGISDLDMIYIMPKSEWDRFKDGRQSALLQEVKNSLKKKYSTTDIKADGQVVVVTFKNFTVEVLPCFEQDDGSFKYPDTHSGGSWKITKPRLEIDEISKKDSEKNQNLRRLCRMIRAWKNKHGVALGGLLIDTLVYKFINSTDSYDDKSYFYYDSLSRDFFKFISELEKQSYYLAPGSNQKVYVKKYFQSKAKKAYNLCLEAIESEKKKSVNDKWRKVFGRSFPKSSIVEKTTESNIFSNWNDTEEHIEDYYPIDIRYNLLIDCNVTQNGFREHTLLYMLSKKIPLLANKKLNFEITENEATKPFEIKWKILNRGEIAKKRNCIRGQIIDGDEKKRESTDFKGEHMVECYIIKNEIVVARSRIDVPIINGGEL